MNLKNGLFGFIFTRPMLAFMPISMQQVLSQVVETILLTLLIATARDFWKMVHDRKCGAIIMLSDLVEEGEVTIIFSM